MVLNIKEISVKIKSLGRAYLHGLMEVHIKAKSSKVLDMVMVSLFVQSKNIHILVIGRKA